MNDAVISCVPEMSFLDSRHKETKLIIVNRHQLVCHLFYFTLLYVRVRWIGELRGWIGIAGQANHWGKL